MVLILCCSGNVHHSPEVEFSYEERSIKMEICIQEMQNNHSFRDLSLLPVLTISKTLFCQHSTLTFSRIDSVQTTIACT